MNHKDILYKAATILNERGKDYGDIEPMFRNVATVATMVLGKEIEAYDVTTIMEILKLIRRRENRKLADNYADNVNYTAFSAQFALDDHEGDTPAALAQQPIEEVQNAQNIHVHFDGSSTTVVASSSD